MLTPQEVSERGFTKVSFGGYNMVQVDEFLDILTGDYTALYSENTALKRKIKVMQDKIDEYRTTEETMRKALLAAQQIAENMVQEGKVKTQKLMDEARQEIEALRKSTLEERHAEEQKLQGVKQVTAHYVEQVRELHRKEKEYLDSLGILTSSETAVPESSHAMPQAPQKSAPVEEAPPAPPAAPESSSMNQDVQAFLERAMAEALGEKKAAELSEDNYQNLQNLYHKPEETVPDSIEATTRFLMNEDFEQAAPTVGSRQMPSLEESEYDAELAQAGSRLDFSRLQQEFGHNNNNQ